MTDMRLKAFAIILSMLSCAATWAQENIDQMVLHLKNGQEVWYSIDEVDSVTFVASGETHDMVDLGLSVFWATCNLGAAAPEATGYFYAWGEVRPKRTYTEANHTHYSNDQYEYIGVNICGTKYDAARKTWGGQWRLPTRGELRELRERCMWTQETLNGVSGYRVTATNGNSIFLPAAGYKTDDTVQEAGTGGFYWSGSLDTSMTSAAYNINFRGYDAEWSASRSYGFSVRPVIPSK